MHMKIHLITVVNKKDKYLHEVNSKLIKNLSAFCDLNLISLKAQKSSKTFSVLRCIEEEGNQILKSIPRDSFSVLLDEGGREFSSVGFSDFLEKHKDCGDKLTFIIGGAFGVSQGVKDVIDFKMSLSKMTFTHKMAKLFLLEQIYRGFCIFTGKEYHHE